MHMYAVRFEITVRWLWRVVQPPHHKMWSAASLYTTDWTHPNPIKALPHFIHVNFILARTYRHLAIKPLYLWQIKRLYRKTAIPPCCCVVMLSGIMAVLLIASLVLCVAFYNPFLRVIFTAHVVDHSSFQPDRKKLDSLRTNAANPGASTNKTGGIGITLQSAKNLAKLGKMLSAGSVSSRVLYVCDPPCMPFYLILLPVSLSFLTFC